MVSVNGYDRDDMEPHKPWASRLDNTELVEMARCQRREVILNYPRKPCKDGWMGPVLPEARDNEATLLHHFRWWFYPCKKGSMPPFKYDGAIDQWRKTVLAFSGDRVYIMQRDDPMSTPIPRLSSYEDVEVMVVARPLRGAEGMRAATVGKGHRNTTYTGLRGPEAPKAKVDVVNATVSVHSFSWHETRCTARDIQSPLLHQALNPKLGIQRV